MAKYDYTILEGLFTEAELLSMRSTLKAAFTGSATIGTQITSVSTPDLSTTFTVGTPPEVMLRCIAYALYKLDPDTYPSPSGASVRRYYTL